MIEISTNWESIVRRDFGEAEGIYILHCISPELCPCNTIHECAGVYTILGWDIWTEWGKENCNVRESPTRWLRDKSFIANLYL